MSVGLKLLPVMGDMICSQEVVNASQGDGTDDAMYERVNSLESSKLYKPINTYLSRTDDGDTCYGPTLDDLYGDRLEHVSAGDLKTCNIGGPAGAYVNELRDARRVLLYWS